MIYILYYTCLLSIIHTLCVKVPNMKIDLIAGWHPVGEKNANNENL